MNEIDICVRIIVGLLLLVSGIVDFKTNMVSVKLVAACTIPLIIMLPFREEITIVDGIFGMLIGVGVLGLGKITRGQIGTGDGLILITIGLGLGGYNNFRMILYGLILAAIFSIFLLIGKKVKFKSTIPFLPFLCMSYVLVLLDTWR